MNIFETASRNKLRFQSTFGSLSVEQLWDLPLTSRGSSDDLDSLAKAANRDLKELEEESFVVKSSVAKSELELPLEILKHIISSKLQDIEDAKSRRDKADQRETLLRILKDKEVSEMEGMSKDDILKQLAEIS